MTTTDPLRDIIKVASIAVAAMFAKRGMISPMWHYVEIDGTRHVIPAPSDDKDTSVAAMRALFAFTPVQRYVFVGEAWRLQTSDPAEADRMRDLERHPRREEIIMFCAEDAQLGGMMASRVIERGPGRRARPGPLVFVEAAGAIEARFMGMLPRKSASLH
jgi:hypothetical protein